MAKIKNKIILLSFDFPPNNGGISRLCNEIVKGLKSRGIQYHVITNVYSPDADETNVTRICGRRGVVDYKILRYLKRHTSKDDIILCDTWHPAGFLAKLSGRRFYVLAHGAELLPGSNFFRKKLWSRYRRHVLRRASGIIANSNYTASLVNSLASGFKVTAIPLAIDSDLFKPSAPKVTDDDILRLCSISRLEKFKGHDFILKTIAGVPTEIRQRIRLEIGGKGPYKETLESLAKELGLNDIVTFSGFIAENALNDFYSRNDIFILCTREERGLRNVEGFGLVFVEAQACGTACIGTNAGGIPDAIHQGYGGWLIEQDSEPQLSALLTKLVADKSYAQSEGEAARMRVLEECSQSQYIENLLKTIYVG